jgi:hypothetical protein
VGRLELGQNGSLLPTLCSANHPVVAKKATPICSLPDQTCSQTPGAPSPCAIPALAAPQVLLHICNVAMSGQAEDPIRAADGAVLQRSVSREIDCGSYRRLDIAFPLSSTSSRQLD